MRKTFPVSLLAFSILLVWCLPAVGQVNLTDATYGLTRYAKPKYHHEKSGTPSYVTPQKADGSFSSMRFCINDNGSLSCVDPSGSNDTKTLITSNYYRAWSDFTDAIPTNAGAGRIYLVKDDNNQTLLDDYLTYWYVTTGERGHMNDAYDNGEGYVLFIDAQRNQLRVYSNSDLGLLHGMTTIENCARQPGLSDPPGSPMQIKKGFVIDYPDLPERGFMLVIGKVLSQNEQEFQAGLEGRISQARRMHYNRLNLYIRSDGIISDIISQHWKKPDLTNETCTSFPNGKYSKQMLSSIDEYAQAQGIIINMLTFQTLSHQDKFFENDFFGFNVAPVSFNDCTTQQPVTEEVDVWNPDILASWDSHQELRIDENNTCLCTNPNHDHTQSENAYEYLIYPYMKEIEAEFDNVEIINIAHDEGIEPPDKNPVDEQTCTDFRKIPVLNIGPFRDDVDAFYNEITDPSAGFTRTMKMAMYADMLFDPEEGSPYNLDLLENRWQICKGDKWGYHQYRRNLTTDTPKGLYRDVVLVLWNYYYEPTYYDLNALDLVTPAYQKIYALSYRQSLNPPPPDGYQIRKLAQAYLTYHNTSPAKFPGMIQATWKAGDICSERFLWLGGLYYWNTTAQETDVLFDPAVVGECEAW